jgi:hypothetical protein
MQKYLSLEFHGPPMGAFKHFTIIVIVLSSFFSAWGLQISYNTTHPLQFLGVESFENLDDVRVIFRAEPISIRAGETAKLNFLVENPTNNLHRVSVSLIDVPFGFSVAGEGLNLQQIVGKNSSEKITFKLTSSESIGPRTYYYAFDVTDETLGQDQKTVVNTSKLLGTYSGINIVEEEVLKSPEAEDIGEVEKEGADGGSFRLIIVLIVLAVLALILRGRIRR